MARSFKGIRLIFTSWSGGKTFLEELDLDWRLLRVLFLRATMESSKLGNGKILTLATDLQKINAETLDYNQAQIYIE